MPPVQTTVIGLMSGTSLDGLDIALCHFRSGKNHWHYDILRAETIPYDDTWRNRLRELNRQDALTFASTDWDFGYYMGELTHRFICQGDHHPDLIASHGQTIFHQPAKGFTVQIGKGAAIAARTGIPVVCDFRSGDVALGGQGAPLVPIGDALLFQEYDYCLNIGGFANISFDRSGQRLAYDIAPANMVLNDLARVAGKPFDENGHLASAGTIIPRLLEQLNNLPFYQQPPPKSLGEEWVRANVQPLLKWEERREKLEVDLLATYCEHLAIQIARNTGDKRVNKLLITGGGAHNTFLVNRIRHHAFADVVIPDNQTIDFKEALIFAFLGLLRRNNEINILSSVTGARRDNMGGALYG